MGQLQGQHHSPVPSTAQLPSLEGQDGIHGSAMEMVESEFDGEKPENDHAEGVMASLASQQVWMVFWYACRIRVNSLMEFNIEAMSRSAKIA